MRDPDRIPFILAELGKTWACYPDQRLGQLIANLVGHHRDIFYVSDQELLDIFGIEDVQEFTGRNNFMDGIAEASSTFSSKLKSRGSKDDEYTTGV